MEKIYLAGPISGLSLDEATEWRLGAQLALESFDLEGVSPLRGANTQSGRFFNPNGDRWASMKTIFNRDHWDIQSCDAMLVNFIGAKSVSRGTFMEIAWAHAYRKPMVMAITKDNPNWDVFMLEAVPFIAPTLEEAVEDILRLFNRK